MNALENLPPASSTAPIASGQIAGDPFVDLTVIQDDAIALLDSLTPVHNPDNDLLHGMPARDLNGATGALVKALADIDVERVRRKFNWFERMTGEDIEARVRFDLATHQLDGLIQGVMNAHETATIARDAIIRDACHLEAIEGQLDTLLISAKAFLTRAGGESFHVERFTKRIADLEIIATSNRMMEEQYALAYQTLTALLDRTGEVTRVLLPLWQQHAFSIAQSSDATDDMPLMEAFSSIHRKICSLLTPEKDR